MQPKTSTPIRETSRSKTLQQSPSRVCKQCKLLPTPCQCISNSFAVDRPNETPLNPGILRNRSSMRPQKKSCLPTFLICLVSSLSSSGLHDEAGSLVGFVLSFLPRGKRGAGGIPSRVAQTILLRPTKAVRSTREIRKTRKEKNTEKLQGPSNIWKRRSKW